MFELMEESQREQKKIPTAKLRIGEILVRHGLISEQQLQLALGKQSELQQFGDSKRLGEIIVDFGFASLTDIEKAINSGSNGKYYAERRNDSFYRSFVQKLIIKIGNKKCGNGNGERANTDEKTIQSVGRKEYYAAVQKKEGLRHLSIIHTLESLGLLSYEESRQAARDAIIELRSIEPHFKDIIVDYDPKDVSVKDGEVYYRTNTSEVKVLPIYYPESTSDIQLLMKYDECINIRMERNAHAPREKTDIVHFVFKDIVKKAIMLGASDIHIIPKSEHYRVFFRVNGLLLEDHDFIMNVEQGLAFSSQIRQDAGDLTKGDYRPEETKKAQPAKIKYDDLGVGVRLEFTPDGWSMKHMKITGRLISKGSKKISGNLSFNLASWGFLEEDIIAISSSIHRRNGIIVVSGETGSGKSTTIWCFLATFPQTTLIVTAEDPIEYTFDNHNIFQCQIFEPENENIRMGFSDYVLSFKRSDPNIIFMGEWRGSEGLTEAIIELANSGQLVFTTLHIQSAFNIYSSLAEMYGVQPYVSARLVRMSLNQLLLPKLCSACRIEDDISFTQDDVRYLNSFSAEEKKILTSKRIKGYKGKKGGCPHCHGTGIDGQVAIYEYFIPDQELISDIIKDKLSPNEIKNRTLMNQMGRSKVMVFLDRLEKGLVEKTSLFEI